MEIAELKIRYSIPRAWGDLNLPGIAGKCVCSPFRQDRSPSFSIFANGMKAKDFATGESFDVFDFIKKARGCSTADAIGFVRERVGVAREPRALEPARARTAQKLPPLRAGTDSELRQLADRRGFAVEALTLAHARGFLFFCDLWRFSSWCLTDQRRELFEFRRVDGGMWPAHGRLPARKCHAAGTKTWPLGTLESQRFPKVAWLEGGADFLAAIHFILLENKAETVAPVSVLGASNRRLAEAAVAKFKGKSVCLYPHLDDPGREASHSWARQLKAAGAARVTAFDFSQLALIDGSAGKDLADVCRINADCFERERKFDEVMP